ncbi:hypothetical protein Cgig2_026488 [Carnegiea gigantea]|uniref:Uncharacterized protein n=1 Tax=Carnegiea gigantea TaxID=171969 RepID=A0A9Q1QIA3_9CARY|nr:hypothetical protein Cgig2_026488 [Carnegiea gigantea]
MKNQDADFANSDTRIAMEKDEDEGLAADENIDMYLNLQNIEDVEMSTDSSKRKRLEEGAYVPFDPMIPALHDLPPGCHVVLSFCHASISSSRNGILARCNCCDCYISTKLDYYGYHGLDLELSSYPQAHYVWFILTRTDLEPAQLKVSSTKDGCWILPKCPTARVAPNSSEQSNTGHQGLSPPPIKQSMMHPNKSETPLLVPATITRTFGAYHAKEILRRI